MSGLEIIGTPDLYAKVAGTGVMPVGWECQLQDSGRIITKSYNTAVGHFALNPDAVIHNTAVGNFALRQTTTGFLNAGVGEGALYANDTGGSNTAMGYYAAGSNVAGSENTAMGAARDVTASLPSSPLASRDTATGACRRGKS